MLKKYGIAIVLIFIVWTALDFVVHGVILEPAYSSTPDLWRPMDEMKMGYMYVVTVIAAAAFAAIYTWVIDTKTVNNGLLYGLLFGVATGVSMGFGSYTFMPMPLSMAIWWFIGSIVQGAAAGWIVGLVIKENTA